MMHVARKLLLSAAALLVFANLCSCKKDAVITNLHAADVPVRALVRPSVDPAAAFPEQFPLQVAVYWTTPEPGILGLVHSLRQMGVPFFVTRGLDQALRHHLLILADDLPAFTAEQTQKLTKFVSAGGSLIAFQAHAGTLESLLGFHASVASKGRHKVIFEPGSDPIESYLNRPEELEAPLGGPKYDELFWTYGYTADPAADVLAHFDDGTAAVIRRKSGAGTTFLFGLSLQDVVLRNQDNRDFDAERHYANAFEPGSDIWMLLLRGWYENYESGAVRLATIPDGQSSVLMLSHDVDWENSFHPMLDYAAMETKHNVKSAFFIQTKYASDANSKAFFFGADLDDLKRLQSLGFPVGSHSVIHSAGFNKFDLGSGTESYGAYQPRGTGFATADNATVFGEIRVSKQLLDGELPGQHTTFFRAGHLRVSPSMPEALQRCGYEFDSSFTAADVLTNFPYALPLDLGFFDDSGLYEFPVTFEDEESPPLDQRIARALDVIRANSENGAINVILIHSNEATSKLAAEEALLQQLPKSVSVMEMPAFARFWRARDRLKWSTSAGQTPRGTRLTVESGEAVEGLTFEFHHRVASVDGSARRLDDHRVVLPALKASESVAFNIRYAD